jgi:hypothetical protein
MRPPSQTYTYGTSQNIPSHLQVYSQQHLDAQRAQLTAQSKYYSTQAFNYPSSTPTPSSTAATPTTQIVQPALDGSSVQSNDLKSPTPASLLVPSGPSLLEQVRTLLTARKLDSAPQKTAQELMDMLLGENVVADKETRTEVLTRMRDHAPAGFFEVIGKNTPMVGLMQSWARGAYKKEELEDTLMPLLQVSLPRRKNNERRKRLTPFFVVK